MEETNLKDICEFIVDCPHSTAKDEGGGYPLIRTPNVGRGRLVLHDVHRVCERIYNERNERAIPSEGDIILAREAPIGNAAIITHGQKVCLGQRVVLIRANRSLVNPMFLVYYLLTDEIQHRLKNNANGAVVAHLNLNEIRELKISIPEIETQNKIAAVLSSFDEKLEINRRINDNLEQQAQASLKIWKEKVRRETHYSTKLETIASFVGGYSYKGKELVPSKIAMATIKNFNRNGGFKLDGYKEIEPSDKIKPVQFANLYDILVAHTDLTQNAEVIGNTELVLSFGGYESIIFSMDLVKVEPKDVFPYKFLLAALLRDSDFKIHCMGYVNGTTVLHMSKKALPEFDVLLPEDEDSICQIDNYLSSIYRKMAEIVTENSRLACLRDTILPKLMSCELKIS